MTWVSDAKQEAVRQVISEISNEPPDTDLYLTQHNAELNRFKQLADMAGIDPLLSDVKDQGLEVQTLNIGRRINGPGNLFPITWTDLDTVRYSNYCIDWVITEPETGEQLSLSLGFIASKRYATKMSTVPFPHEVEDPGNYVWDFEPTITNDRIVTLIKDWLIGVFRRHLDIALY